MKRFLWSALSVAVLASAWFAFAPRHLPGGSAAYVVPSGASMLPLLHRGDLVVVREAAGYGVGDVVAYQSRDLETVVLHRIIRLEGDRFVLKGDNNSFIDSDRPTESDLIGRLWLRVPGAGNVLEWLRDPRNSAILAGTVAFLLVGGVAGTKVRRARRRRRSTEAPVAKKSPPAVRSTRQVRLAAAAVLAAALVGFLGLALLSFTRPLTTTALTEQRYTHNGTFEYSAPAPLSEVYDRAAVATGEPVFLRLVPEVSVSFQYRMEADAPHAISGTTRLTAALADDTGWSRTLELQPLTAFTGDSVTVSGALDLDELRRLMQRVEELTRISRSGFTLTLMPVVEVEGTIATRPVEDSFAPELAFRLDPLLLQVDSPDDPDREAAELFERTRGGFVTGELEVPSRLSGLGIGLEVATARRVAVIGLGASVILALIVGGLALVRRPKDEPARISARYGHLLVPVEADPGLLTKGTVDVATMEALVQVAERYERSILHDKQGGDNTYLVEGDVLVYRYRAGGPPVRLERDPLPGPRSRDHVPGDR